VAMAWVVGIVLILVVVGLVGAVANSGTGKNRKRAGWDGCGGGG